MALYKDGEYIFGSISPSWSESTFYCVQHIEPNNKFGWEYLVCGHPHLCITETSADDKTVFEVALFFKGEKLNIRGEGSRIFKGRILRVLEQIKQDYPEWRETIIPKI